MTKITDIILTYAEAASFVEQQCAQILQEPRSFERATLDGSLGRVLAEEVMADRDHPPFDRSTRDGFAARAADWIDDESLRIVGMVRAGEVWTDIVGKGQAVEIMTGAPLPAGADCVAMVEHTHRDGAEVRLAAKRHVSRGDNVVGTGAEAAAGSTIIPAGTLIGFRQIAVAAACGYDRLLVFRRPVAHILATGDELVEIAATPLNHQIRNSNSASLAAQVALTGSVARSALVPDDRGAIDHALADALEADLILLSGGVSMGRYDFVEEVLAARGAQFFFTGVKMQPGRPVVFGRLPMPSGGWKYFFGLPGNPVSTMVTFALFAAPVLRAMAGQRDGEPVFGLATLGGDLNTGSGLTRFLPGERTSSHSATVVVPIAWQGSGDLAANAHANCYIVVPAESTGLKAGQVVSVLIQ